MRARQILQPRGNLALGVEVALDHETAGGPGRAKEIRRLAPPGPRPSL
jgi:hypothetical protein